MNPIKDATELSAILGESFTLRKINGRVVITNRPRRKVVARRSTKQIAAQQRFKEAHLWARQQMQNPDIKAMYASRITGKLKSAFTVAVTDYLNPPKVQEIDTRDYKGGAGNVVVIKAVDDFIILRMEVTISDATGKVLEQGKAVQSKDSIFLWDYTATAANRALAGTKISVTAFDRGRNDTVLEKVL